MKLLALLLVAFSWTAHGASQENQQGFQVSKALSANAVAHNSDSYPKGTVMETMSSGGYTYFQFKHKDQLTWAASSPVDIKKGDHVILMKSFPMNDFTSKSLNRTFDELLLVSQLDVVRESAN